MSDSSRTSHTDHLTPAQRFEIRQRDAWKDAGRNATAPHADATTSGTAAERFATKQRDAWKKAAVQ